MVITMRNRVNGKDYKVEKDSVAHGLMLKNPDYYLPAKKKKVVAVKQVPFKHPIDFDSMNMKELTAEAKAVQLKGYSTLKKQELIKALKEL